MVDKVWNGHQHQMMYQAQCLFLVVFTPTIDNFHNLGSATHRWANLHTGDIQLSNEGTEGNEVDGTTGNLDNTGR